MYVLYISPSLSKSILDSCGWFLMGRIYSLHQENIPIQGPSHWSLSISENSVKPCSEGTSRPTSYTTCGLSWRAGFRSQFRLEFLTVQAGLEGGKEMCCRYRHGSLFVWLWSNLDSFQVLSFPLLTQTADSLGFIFNHFGFHTHIESRLLQPLYIQ